ncbi:class I SAM-dependent methyltransferase [Desulfovulcanus sp.]
MSKIKYSLESPLEELLEIANSKFETYFEPVKVGEHTLEILQIAEMDQYIDKLVNEFQPGQKIELPLWAKIWPASILLSYFINSMEAPTSKKTVLEIEAGVGLCGLFAALKGFDVIISDRNDDALLFTKINILKNNLEGRATVAKVDFTKDRLNQKFDYILGSEVLYQEETYRPLIKFFLAHLKSTPHAEVILAKDYRRKAKKFFNLAPKDFKVAEKTIGYRQESETGSQDERFLCTIYRLHPRKMKLGS